MKRTTMFALLWVFAFGASGQVNFTANDLVPEYQDFFRPGVNPGVFNQWTDEQLADLAAGNPYLGINGIGAKSIRPTLPEYFLDTYGYEVRLGAFDYYQQLGMEQNVCFIGYPNLIHRDTNIYCAGASISKLFANMYLPIWDGGANGTPYNDDNYLAAYTYEMVSIYKDYVRFWEIWNEPSLDQSNYKATLPPGHPESWWDNDPDPCDMDIQAPVYHYIRMLRVCYDVIKTLDPDAFVTLGGIGYNSFMDVLCRNTDNPVDGSMTAEFPLTGAAYFDAVGIHTYPHFDGSTIFINNGQLEYQRHSDAAAEGIVIAKNGRQAVLDDYGYDGNIYPKKKYLITEINLPRIKFEDFLGSNEAQRNFMTKALLTSMSNDICQLHIYNLGDIENESTADSWFDVMGLYGNLNTTPPYTQQPTEAGIAFKTAADILYKTEWDSVRSAQMNLPPDVRGGAVKKEDGSYVYVLWAKTQIDESELASATYSFPSVWNIAAVFQKKWDYSETLFESSISSQNIALNATPAFFTETPTVPHPTDMDVSDCVETINGFNYIGQYLGNKYFRSNNALTWEEAKTFCEAQGGNLVEINSYAENYFLQNKISSPVFIGLSDATTEGVLEWSNGASLDFNNIEICNFCNPNTTQNDYVVLNSWDGKWSFESELIAKNFILEFDCLNDTLPNNGGGNPTSGCGENTPGFTLLGELGGKEYFISNGANNWTDSKILCEAQGGNLVIIDDQIENNFIQGKINELVFIGLSDQQQEGNLQWVDGSNLNYENLDICNFCGANSNLHDFVIMHPWNGGWSFATPSQSFRAIMERACDDNSGGGNDCNTNLALNASVSQSSTQQNGIPQRAVDGNTDGNFWSQQSTSMTNWEAQPWFEIDLGSVQDIGKIEIWNRDDCCSNLLSNYQILISNNPFTNDDLNTILNQNGVTNFLRTDEAERPTTQDINQSGRYIRIQLTGTAFLAISEVKVFGCGNTSCPPAGTPCDDNNPLTFNDMEDGNCTCAGTPDIGNTGCTAPTNLALNQPATQSSTLTAAGITGDASKAVDGNSNGIFFTNPSSNSSVSATQNELQPWWQVDLGEDFLIEEIQFFNRTDGVDKSRDCYVMISDTPFTNSDLAAARAQASYEYFIQNLVGSPSVINPNVEGRYVRVQMEGSGYLVIGELEIFGCTAPQSQNFAVPNLLKFEAEKIGQEAALSWWMFKDDFVKKYELEVSTDALNFEFLAALNSNQKSMPSQYQFLDQQPARGENFYRLKIIQNDGAIHFTYPRRVNFDIDFEKIFIYPNPTSTSIFLTLRDFAGKAGTVEVYNNFGQKMWSQNYVALPSIPLQLEVDDWVSGMYSVVVKVDSHRLFSKKFMVTKE